MRYAFGQLAKCQARRPALALDTELAFGLVGLSFPLTVVLNTAACLGGDAYVRALPAVGLALLGAAVALKAANREQISRFAS